MVPRDSRGRGCGTQCKCSAMEFPMASACPSRLGISLASLAFFTYRIFANQDTSPSHELNGRWKAGSRCWMDCRRFVAPSSTTLAPVGLGVLASLKVQNYDGWQRAGNACRRLWSRVDREARRGAWPRH